MALRDIILRFDERIQETVKYGMPCFTINGKALCYLWTDKKTKEPYVLIVNGDKIDHPMLEKGDRKRMKILRVSANKDIPNLEINTILKMAMSLDT